MTGQHKDSDEVVRFMSLLAKLKSASSDQPAKLPRLARTDETVAELCRELELVGNDLRKAERKRKTLFAMPVDPSFIDAWRDYEERYAATISLFGLFALIDELPPTEFSDKPPKSLSERWEEEDTYGFVASDALENLIQFAFDIGTDETAFDDDEIEQIKEGVQLDLPRRSVVSAGVRSARTPSRSRFGRHAEGCRLFACASPLDCRGREISGHRGASTD
ncbi:hypothetical protein [Ruegeria marisrubri]|uniref:hypothetical protein n=1 Tax=Ruegeria marisrubri TaxID=1685379 RepID=UPI000AB3BA8C|nr:hypothetical protein [Ruegeria marisrubri]